jgi:hypothetical protein
MIAGLLLDEHLPKWWSRDLRRAMSELIVWRVLLLTNNRKSMPKHLADYVAMGRHVPGIFVVDPRVSIPVLAATLTLIAGASLEDEYRDQIQYLPALDG